MYNLIVTAEEDAWSTGRYSLPLDRVGEHTAESLRVRYKDLTDEGIQELLTFPTIFAYEEPRHLPARLGRVTHITRPSGSEARFKFTILETVQAIPPEKLTELAWDLDIGRWEMNRTHWAVKDVDVLDVLRDAGLIQENQIAGQFAIQTGLVTSPVIELPIVPTVFAVPAIPRDDRLVAVMMPFAREFDPVYEAIQKSCKNVGLSCRRADDIWEESTVIQDVFNLIFRSRLVVADLTGHNPNVLYEVGIAHTLGRPVVPIGQASASTPFDLAHHRTLAYLANEQGLREMQVQLQRRLTYLTS